MLMAHAARDSLVTVEEIVDGDLTADPVTAAGTIPGLYVTALAEAKQGAWPQALPGGYRADAAHLARYAELARPADGFATYLAERSAERRVGNEWVSTGSSRGSPVP